MQHLLLTLAATQTQTLSRHITDRGQSGRLQSYSYRQEKQTTPLENPWKAVMLWWKMEDLLRTQQDVKEPDHSHDAVTTHPVFQNSFRFCQIKCVKPNNKLWYKLGILWADSQYLYHTWFLSKYQTPTWVRKESVSFTGSQKTLKCVCKSHHFFQELHTTRSTRYRK